jgi:hypothetical protein
LRKIEEFCTTDRVSAERARPVRIYNFHGGNNFRRARRSARDVTLCRTRKFPEI